MSKKNDKNQQEPDGAQQPPQPAAPAQPAEEKSTVSTAQIWTFWGVVAATVLLARVLDAALPGTPEHVIERWLMLAFGVFMAVFLARL
jgi:hypothetical protein